MYCEVSNSAVSGCHEVLSHALVLARITVLHTGDLQAASINYPQPTNNTSYLFIIPNYYKVNSLGHH